MPKCDADVELHREVKRFMSENRMNVNAAAKALGVHRTTFWRFCDSGRALSGTKQLYREALEKRNKLNSDRVSFDAIDAGAPTIQPHSAMQRLLADRELKQIRKACEGVLALLDAYESQIAGQKNLKAFQSSN